MKNYFKKSEFMGLPAILSYYQKFLYDHLLYTLNVIRQEVGSPMIITSCGRDMGKFNSMIRRGYFPSPTSDHFWGLPVPCSKAKHKKIYGKNFTMSVGAVDFITPRASMFQVFKLAIKLSMGQMIRTGQLIFESRTKPTPAQWIHLSNPRDLVFDPDFLNKIGAVKSPLLFTKDGGKNYHIFKL